MKPLIISGAFFIYLNLKCYFEQKTKHMKKYIGIVILSSFIACSNSDHKSENHSDSTSAITDSSQKGVVRMDDPQVAQIYNAYIGLKDDLVQTNYDAAQASAKNLLTSLNAKDGCESTALIAEKIVSAKDIATQRKEFTILSSDVIAMFKHADLQEGTIYVQHCPMANNGDGGDWLSSEKKIQNPYYGDEMMECGAVIEEIKK